MSKPYPGHWILRTLLFTAGHNEKYIEKALYSDADCIVLDLEDAVPVGLKEKARNLIRQVLSGTLPSNKPIMVRINPIETGMTLVDLDSVACKNLCGFIYPKPYRKDDIKVFDAQLSLKEKILGLEVGHFDIIPLIETPMAVLNSYEIATASPRVIGLLFGCEDFLADMESDYGPEQRSLLLPRHLLCLAARAANVVPIDTPCVQVYNDAYLKEHIQQAKELGFEGMLVMTPHQIEIARESYTPSDEEVAEAAKIVQFADDALKNNRGIAMYENRFISPPTLKGARKILRRSEAIKSFEDSLK